MHTAQLGATVVCLSNSNGIFLFGKFWKDIIGVFGDKKIHSNSFLGYGVISDMMKNEVMYTSETCNGSEDFSTSRLEKVHW